MKKNTFKCAGNIGSGRGVTLARSAKPLLRAIKKENARFHLITLRCSAEDKGLIQTAANYTDVSLSKFVLDAAEAQAKEVISLRRRMDAP
jgi:hypothetical protein